MIDQDNYSLENINIDNLELVDCFIPIENCYENYQSFSSCSNINLTPVYSPNVSNYSEYNNTNYSSSPNQYEDYKPPSSNQNENMINYNKSYEFVNNNIYNTNIYINSCNCPTNMPNSAADSNLPSTFYSAYDAYTTSDLSSNVKTYDPYQIQDVQNEDGDDEEEEEEDQEEEEEEEEEEEMDDEEKVSYEGNNENMLNQNHIDSLVNPMNSVCNLVKTSNSSNSNTENKPKRVAKSKSGKDSTEKPPEPYADIIVKAILSSGDNLMQLRDIYDYMIENYEYFALKIESNKWRNSVRHNLSRHKYFVKSFKKTAKGHYWSVNPSFIQILKNNSCDSKTIKKIKLNSKPRKTKLSKKTNPKQNDETLTSFLDGLENGSLNNSPIAKETKLFNTTSDYNDSAYLSSNDTDSSSINIDTSSYKFLANRSINNLVVNSQLNRKQFSKIENLNEFRACLN